MKVYRVTRRYASLWALLPLITYTSTTYGWETANIHTKSQRFRLSLQQDSIGPVHTWPYWPSTQSSNSTRFAINGSKNAAISNSLIHSSRSEAGFAMQHQFVNHAGFATVQLNIDSHLYSEQFCSEQANNAQSNNFDADSFKTNLDGSSAGFFLGHWSMAVGAVDRWWGPSWQSPLILSNNARPIPMLSLDRTTTQPSDWDFLRWLGPWHLSTFIGQLESDRQVAKPLLWGLRASVMPIDGVELGISRTAMFGGGNRQVNLKTIVDVVIGKDNGVNQPGNQLGSFDISYKYATGLGSHLVGHEFYVEIAGEDEAHYFPTKKFATTGYTGFIDLQQGAQALHYLMEYSNTTAGSFGERDIPGITYAHHIFPDGYTFNNEVIGSPLGADKQAITIGMWLDQSASDRPQTIGFWLSRQKDQRSAAQVASSEPLQQLALWVERPCFEFQCKLSLDFFNQPVRNNQIDDTGKDFALGVQWQWQL